MNKQKTKSRLPYSNKYENSFFVGKYVALWAYGYRNNIGQSEGLYRTIDELGFSCLDKNGSYRILDVGCGVGRTAADYAKFFRNAEIIGIDSSHLMIKMACRINKANKKIFLDLNKLGFKKILIKAKNIENLDFKKITLEDFFRLSPKNSFDLVTAANFMDRVTDIKRSFEMIFNLLKDEGILIFASPLNFSNFQDWSKYGSFKSVSKLARSIGFKIDIAFDGLIYKEILDARGAIEEYPTVVMRLIKTK